ncbi:MAG: hypothetical protein R3362_00930 [Rhodothermales bacterium]|nr:hypothetical protein [Rhodothermales bacterium]
MPPSATPPPLGTRALADAYFIENRNRLIDIAAFLDRLDRAEDADEAEDFRLDAFRAAVRVLCEGEFPRVERIQMLFSDKTREPREALEQKGACGVYERWSDDVAP